MSVPPAAVSAPTAAPAATEPAAAPARALEAREGGLRRTLGAGQITMIGLGGAIGTGLFLGSSIAIHYAGPAVLLSYLLAALITVVIVFSLSEMAVVHPVAGSFGSYAELYLGPLAGFLLRTTYAMGQVLVIGSEAVAVGTYASYWFPAAGPLPFALASIVLVAWLNSRPVARFASVETLLTALKVGAIVFFIAVGVVRLLGVSGTSPGFSNLTGLPGGFLPHGLGGVWMASLAALFSFFGIEFVVATAGEAADPGRAIPAALRTMALRLVLFYGLGIGVLVTLLPWTTTGAGTVAGSPFVRVCESVGIPGAATLMNGVVTIAALSAMNTSLYLSARMLFSLAKAGDAPALLGRLSDAAVPRNASLVIAGAALVAVLAAFATPSAYGVLFGIALFAGVFGWVMILLSHLGFRRAHAGRALALRMPLFPWLQWAALLVLGALVVTMAFDAEFWRIAPLTGLPWLALMAVIYRLRHRETP